MFLTDLSAVERRIALLDGNGAPADSAPFTRLLSPSALAPDVPAPPPAARETPAGLEGLIETSGARYGVDPALIKAVVGAESSFDPYATSKTGAQGLMQLMPGTAAELGVSDAYDPAQNIDGGTRYLRTLLDRFGGDPRRAVAAYNAGPGAVERYDGVPPYVETQAYVTRVLEGYAALRQS
jgi:soluble lytic murein transglycosylase-like protein